MNKVDKTLLGRANAIAKNDPDIDVPDMAMAIMKIIELRLAGLEKRLALLEEDKYD